MGQVERMLRRKSKSHQGNRMNLLILENSIWKKEEQLEKIGGSKK
jgi:hypothetical protein